jgi:magnesium-transporting ATPase (P-type)
VAQRLETDPERGLTWAEAARRLADYGRNELRAAAPIPMWSKLLTQFRDPLVYLLLAGIVVALAAWIFEGRQGWPLDAIVIGVIVLLNAVLGLVQEARAADAVHALSRLTAVSATVVRDGERRRVPAAELVPGDILLLEEGDAITADARLHSSQRL